MRGNRFQAIVKERTVQRTPAPALTEELPEFQVQQPNILGLQRLVGNKGVQSLLAQGRISCQGSLVGGTHTQTAPSIQRCGCGGTCAACKGGDEELTVSTASAAEVRRWWDDEEEESGDSGGGSWLDDATDEVSSWFGGDETESGDTGGGYYEPEDSGGGSGGGSSWWGGEEEEESEGDGGGGSWWDDAADEVNSWFDEDESEAESDDSGVSWWDELWSDEEEESEGEDSDDWDWFDEEESDEEEAQDIPDISAECETEDGIGFGTGTPMKLHGLTEANYNHGKPVPEPFPSGVTVTTGKAGKDDIFNAKGTFEVDFLASPSISLPSVPSGLTPCQEKAVQAFIDGPLTAHENDHKAAFKSNYDGKFTATVDVSNIKDTADNRKIAMTNPVNKEDQARTKKANAESKKLDPWTQTVTGLDCK